MAHMQCTIEEVTPILENAIEDVFKLFQNKYGSSGDISLGLTLELEDYTYHLANLIAEQVNGAELIS